MKKYFYLLITLVLLFSSACNDDLQVSDYKTYTIAVKLNYPDSISAEGDTIKYITKKGAKVSVYNNSDKHRYDGLTDESGIAVFEIPGGVYRAVANESRATVDDGFINLFNGNVESIGLSGDRDIDNPIEIRMTRSLKGQVIIKELYVGGCQKDDKSGTFQYDKYVILYNNTDLEANLDRLCIGMVMPYNAQGTNNDYVNGSLVYADSDSIPAGSGIWYYPRTLILKPGEQAVVALNNATDNTKVYSNSINFSNPKYFCTYDNLHYPNAAYYGVPDPVIPRENYWSAVRYGLGNAWPLSANSPAFFIFTTGKAHPDDEDYITPVEFATNTAYMHNYGGNSSAANREQKVSVDWILDGVEVFTTSSADNKKRFTPKVDVGYTYLQNTFGYTSYRNVDVEATLAVEGNEDKLVYNYSRGTMVGDVTSTDPSGIDAEASIKNGARIIYMDTNNSTIDFHQRSQASLRD